jgi:hypothetical protein
VKTEVRGGTAAPPRALLLVTVLGAVVVYGVVISVMIEANYNQNAVLVMLAVSTSTGVLLRRHPLLMMAAVIGIVVYSFCVFAATNIATGREQDPFGPHCKGEWESLIFGEKCGEWSGRRQHRPSSAGAAVSSAARVVVSVRGMARGAHRVLDKPRTTLAGAVARTYSPS